MRRICLIKEAYKHYASTPSLLEYSWGKFRRIVKFCLDLDKYVIGLNIKLAQPIRLLLKYTQTDFEDKRYVVGPGFDKSCWFDVKYSLGLDFPNVSS